MGFENIYVMEGGLNKWFADIMQPEMPPATAPNEAIDLYTFRKGASLYFGGGSEENMGTDMKGKDVKIIRRNKKAVTAGGC